MAASNANPRMTAKICEHMTFAGREAYKRLRTNIMIALEKVREQEKTHFVIGVTSAQPSEGKSTTSINLAYSMAELGNSVLLIDGDLRRPSIHTNIGATLSPGLSEVLEGSAKLKDITVHYQSTASETTFDILVAGEYPSNPAELLNSNRFRKLIEAASAIYDYVIIDLPPVNAVVDAVAVSKCTDGLIVVIRENHCPRGVLASCIEQLQYANVNILGVVMNGCVSGSRKKYYYNKNSYYQYGNYGYYGK